jgi:hypothetical protein
LQSKLSSFDTLIMPEFTRVDGGGAVCQWCYADITAPGLRLYVRGEKNKFISPGRNENPFAPKSSRITRHLLYQAKRTWTQRELADETGLGEGFVSRIVKTLEAQQLIGRDDQEDSLPARQR